MLRYAPAPVLACVLVAAACASSGDPREPSDSPTAVFDYSDPPICFELRADPGASPRPPSEVKVVKVAQYISPPPTWPPFWDEIEELANLQVELPEALGLERRSNSLLQIVTRDLERNRALSIGLTCGRPTGGRRSDRGLDPSSPARARVSLAESRRGDCRGRMNEYRLGEDGSFQWGGRRSAITANRVDCPDR